MLRYSMSLARRCPKTTLLVLFVFLLLLAGGGGYAYALHEWHAAQEAVKDMQTAQAQKHLELCLRVWPRSPQVHLLAARVARWNEDFESAEAHLQQCLKLQHGATEATQIEFMLLRAQMGDEDEVAPSLFKYVDAKHPETSTILDTLARAYMRHLRYGVAYSCLSRWIQEHPDTARAYHWRGWVLERMDSYQEAMKDYKRALDVDPDLVPVRLRLAEMLMEDKQPLDALPHLERLYREYPDRAIVKARLGQCRFLQGKVPEARALMEDAVKELPDDAALLVYLGKLENQNDRPVQAERWLRHALEVDAGDLEALVPLITSLQMQHRDDEAATFSERLEKEKTLVSRTNQLLREEAEHPTRDPNVAWEIGTLLLRINRDRQGLYWLHDQALGRDPHHQPTHKTLAEYYEAKGDREQAAVHRRALVQTDGETGRQVDRETRR